MKEYEYKGHLHIHSSFSDGSAPVEEIARAASRAGLDFIGITDHNNLAGLEKGLEGRHHGVLVLFGTEINMRKNHYIAFGVRETIPPDEENPQNVIDAVNTKGGFGYLAHPVEKGSPFLMKGRNFAWDKWGVSGFTGLEIWNFGSLWRGAYKNRAEALFWYFFNPYRGARVPDPDGLKIWDALAQERRVVAFAGSDAHAVKVKFGPLRLCVFPYQLLFRTFNTHVLLPEELDLHAAAAREQIYAALKTGRFFIGSDYLSPSGGFRFTALHNDNGGQVEMPMGGEIPYTPATLLHIESPSRRGTIRIIKNGRLVYESRQQVLAFKVLSPGTFRVEVHWRSLMGRPLPWIYSNPIYVI